jgi:hypothetical protein
MIPSPHSPTASPHDATDASGAGPDGHCGKPSHGPWLEALLRQWAACAAGHPAPTPPSPYPDGSGALPPTPKPATGRCLGRGPPWGATLHPGQSRAPGQPGATRPGQVAISTQRHPQAHTASRWRRASRPPLCLAARPRPGRRLCAPDANSGQARCDRRRAGRSAIAWRRAPRGATVPVSLAGVRGLDGPPSALRT